MLIDELQWVNIKIMQKHTGLIRLPFWPYYANVYRSSAEKKMCNTLPTLLTCQGVFLSHVPQLMAFLQVFQFPSLMKINIMILFKYVCEIISVGLIMSQCEHP